jgi:hypothetical protein
MRPLTLLAAAAGLGLASGSGVLDMCASTFPIPLDLERLPSLEVATNLVAGHAAGARCAVTLAVAPGSQVAVDLLALSTQAGVGVLTVHDGPSAASPALAAASGELAAAPATALHSSGRFLTLAFSSSDAGAAGSGARVLVRRAEAGRRTQQQRRQRALDALPSYAASAGASYAPSASYASSASYAPSASFSPVPAFPADAGVVVSLCYAGGCSGCPPTATLPLGVCSAFPGSSGMLVLPGAGGYSISQCQVGVGGAAGATGAPLLVPANTCTSVSGLY